MPNPQQPELRRSGHHAVDDDAPATILPAQGRPRAGGEIGPVPDDNMPGHHPAEDQDKPEGDDFVAKAREVAARARADEAVPDEAPFDEDEARLDETGSPLAAGVASAPPSAASVAEAPATSSGPATEADAPRATGGAVAAQALGGAVAPEALGGAAGTPTGPGGSGEAGRTATSPPSGGGNPITAIAAFQWRVATLPVRVLVDALGRIRRWL